MENGSTTSAPPKSQVTCNKKFLIGLTALISVLTGLGIGLGVGFSTKGSYENSTSVSTNRDYTGFDFKSTVKSRKYVYLTYDQIVQRLKSMAAAYPDLVEIYTTQERFSLPSAGSCTIDGARQDCKV
jgi:hypothetical protein